MNAIEMVQRCARHGSPRGLGLSWREAGRRHDEQECRQIGEKAQQCATQSPNLLVWNGRSHLLAIEIKEDEWAPLQDREGSASLRGGAGTIIAASGRPGPADQSEPNRQREEGREGRQSERGHERQVTHSGT